MPAAARRPCSRPGCPRLAALDDSRCDDHQTTHGWAGQATFEDRYGMGRAEFDRLRRAVLARDQHVCYLCGARDCVTADHITPVSEGGARRDTRNWAAICGDCHHQKTRREAARGQRRARARRRSPNVTDP